jgi:hypothetical protein
MRTREDTAKFVAQQMSWKHECARPKGDKFHYGWQELRELMDFIYEGAPTTDTEMLKEMKR